jgi:hypothetical protein
METQRSIGEALPVPSASLKVAKNAINATNENARAFRFNGLRMEPNVQYEKRCRPGKFNGRKTDGQTQG